MPRITEYTPGSYKVDSKIISVYMDTLVISGDNVGIRSASKVNLINPARYDNWIDPSGNPYASLNSLVADLKTFFFDINIDAQPYQGFIDYNDTTGNVVLTSGVWTNIPNDGAGAFSNSTYKPNGVNELLDVSTGAIDCSDLDLGDTILIRNDFTVNPNTNNSLLEFRYSLGQSTGSYVLSTNLGRLDDGSGKPYRFALKPDLIYMGDTNTKDNPIVLQVRLSSSGILTNAGTVIQVIKRSV